MDKSNVCCFTGHRILPKNFNIKMLENAVLQMIENGVDTFICGGALGFDTLCAKYIIKLKRKMPNIKLWLMAPCIDQSSRWGLFDRRVYQAIIKNCDMVDMVKSPYYDGCMKERNYKMVDHSDNCICYYDGSIRSGTGQTVRYAIKCGLNIINLHNE